MITKTVNLDSAYDELFDAIRAKSNGRIDINSIEEFFGNVENIEELDPKFLRLPLDEPIFEIDANTRKIEVPADFRANGVSVQGDHLAETVFFTIDRYFDHADLGAGDMDIVINWKMGQETGRTKRYSIDLESNPGHIIFGWPIDKIVSAKSGSLQFAVEFVKKNKETNDLIYRFNTLPANVNIRDGLVVDDEVEAVDLSDAIKRSLTNSAFAGEGEAAVGDVTWLTGDGHGLVTGAALDGPGGTIISFNPQEWQDTLNLDTVIGGENNPMSISINLIAQAFVDNQTVIRYTDSNNNRIDAAMVKVDESRVLVEDRVNLDDNKLYYIGNGASAAIATAEDKADESISLYEVAPLSENLIYYVQIAESDPAAYREATEEELAKWGTVNKVDLYSKIATIKVDRAGIYAIKAQGEKYISVDNADVQNEYTEAIATLEEIGAEVPEELRAKAEESRTVTRKIGAGNVKVSDVITVPAAVGPTSISVKGETIDGFNPVGENYTVDESVENVIYMPEDSRSLIAKAIFENLGAAKFVWQKGRLSDGRVSFSDIDGFVPQYVLGSENGDTNTLVDASEGYYRVLVTNFINATESDPTPSDTYILSKLASPVVEGNIQYKNITATNIQGSWDNITTGMISFRKGKSITLRPGNVTLADPERSQKLEYSWFVTSDDVSVLPEEEVIWEERTLTENEKANGEVLINVEGYYKPVIKNIYNGSIYTKELEPIYVNETLR